MKQCKVLMLGYGVAGKAFARILQKIIGFFRKNLIGELIYRSAVLEKRVITF